MRASDAVRGRFFTVVRSLQVSDIGTDDLFPDYRWLSAHVRNYGDVFGSASGCTFVFDFGEEGGQIFASEGPLKGRSGFPRTAAERLTGAVPVR